MESPRQVEVVTVEADPSGDGALEGREEVLQDLKEILAPKMRESEKSKVEGEVVQTTIVEKVVQRRWEEVLEAYR
jgi:hypothetical protein